MKKKLKDNPALSSTPGDKAPEKLGECSWCKSVKNPSTLPVPSLIEKIRGIKNGTWCAEVEDVRKGKKNKTEIPEICIYGLFSRSREDKNLKSRSGFIAIDYDKKDNPNLDFTDLKAWLSKLPFVLAVFASTSGKGLKAIVRIPCIAFNVQKELCKEVLSAHEGVIDMSPAVFSARCELLSKHISFQLLIACFIFLICKEKTFLKRKRHEKARNAFIYQRSRAFLRVVADEVTVQALTPAF